MEFNSQNTLLCGRFLKNPQIFMVFKEKFVWL